MTIEEVLAQVDELKPNQYSDIVKISWLSKLDAKIFIEVISRYEIEKEEPEKEEEEEEELIARESEEPEEPENPDEPEDEPEDVPILPDIPEHDDTDDENKEDDITVFNGYTVNDMSTTLLVDEAYADLYVDYIFAQIDYNNQELDRYNNSMFMFNSKYADFKNYYNRTHKIKSTNYKIW